MRICYWLSLMIHSWIMEFMPNLKQENGLNMGEMQNKLLLKIE